MFYRATNTSPLDIYKKLPKTVPPLGTRILPHILEAYSSLLSLIIDHTSIDDPCERAPPPPPPPWKQNNTLLNTPLSFLKKDYCYTSETVTFLRNVCKQPHG